jgi:hypothetical protein
MQRHKLYVQCTSVNNLWSQTDYCYLFTTKFVSFSIILKFPPLSIFKEFSINLYTILQILRGLQNVAWQCFKRRLLKYILSKFESNF